MAASAPGREELDAIPYAMGDMSGDTMCAAVAAACWAAAELAVAAVFCPPGESGGGGGIAPA